MMGLFSYVYYSSLIRVSTRAEANSQTRLTNYRSRLLAQVHHVDVGTVIDTIVNSLTAAEQLEVYYDLRRYLKGQGVLAGPTSS